MDVATSIKVSWSAKRGPCQQPGVWPPLLALQDLPVPETKNPHKYICEHRHCSRYAAGHEGACSEWSPHRVKTGLTCLGTQGSAQCTWDCHSSFHIWRHVCCCSQAHHSQRYLTIGKQRMPGMIRFPTNVLRPVARQRCNCSDPNLDPRGNIHRIHPGIAASCPGSDLHSATIVPNGHHNQATWLCGPLWQPCPGHPHHRGIRIFSTCPRLTHRSAHRTAVQS